MEEVEKKRDEFSFLAKNAKELTKLLQDSRFENSVTPYPGVFAKSAQNIEGKRVELHSDAKERAKSVQADEIVEDELQLPSPLEKPLGVNKQRSPRLRSG